MLLSSGCLERSEQALLSTSWRYYVPPYIREPDEIFPLNWYKIFWALLQQNRLKQHHHADDLMPAQGLPVQAVSHMPVCPPSHLPGVVVDQHGKPAQRRSL